MQLVNRTDKSLARTRTDDVMTFALSHAVREDFAVAYKKLIDEDIVVV